MKKTFLLLLCLALLSGSFAGTARAQSVDCPKNEIGLSYGYFNNTLVIEVFADIFEAIFGKGIESSLMIGPVGVEYFHNVSRVIGVGGIGTYSYFRNTYTDDGGCRFGRAGTLMPAVKINWLRRDGWGAYSKVGAGATIFGFEYDDETKNASPDVFFNFQASLVGVEFGRKMRGFAEIGAGEQGYFLCGVRYRL